MVRRAFFLSMLVLLVVTVRLAPAFDAGDGSEPMDQYQEDFKRQNLGAALGVDPNTVERLLQIDHKYRAGSARRSRMPRRRSSSSSGS